MDRTQKTLSTLAIVLVCCVVSLSACGGGFDIPDLPEKVVGYCTYENPMTNIEECKDFLGNWTIEEASEDCERYESKLVIDKQCDIPEEKKFGYCVFKDDEENEQFSRVDIVGDNTEKCASMQRGCEFFGGGSFVPSQVVCKKLFEEKKKAQKEGKETSGKVDTEEPNEEVVTPVEEPKEDVSNPAEKPNEEVKTPSESNEETSKEPSNEVDPSEEGTKENEGISEPTKETNPACTPKSKGKKPYPVVKRDGEKISIAWGEGAAIALFITDVDAKVPFGPGQKVKGGSTYWAISSKKFPVGFKGPLVYGVLPDKAKDDSEFHGANANGTPLEKGICYKITVVTTSFKVKETIFVQN